MIVSTAEQALDFIGNILESSIEYSIIGKDPTRRIMLWNEGTRRLYSYKPGEVIGEVERAATWTDVLTEATETLKPTEQEAFLSVLTKLIPML